MTCPAGTGGRDARPASWREAGRHVLPAYLASRALIVLAGTCALSWWGVDPVEAAKNYRAASSPIAAVDMWLRYDANWYLAIASSGYTGPVPASYDMRPAFFPAYPALVAGLAFLVGGPVTAGLLVANAACLLFFACTWLIVAEDLGARIATRTVWMIALFPSSFFLSGIYTESTMLAAVTACAVALRRRVWWAAALAAAVAATSRTVGFLVVLPAAWELWRSAAPVRARIAAAGAVAVAMGVALGAYLWIAALDFGDPLHAVEVQHWYRGATSWPWHAFRPWLEAPAWHGYDNSTLDASLAVLALGLAIAACRTWNPAYGLYALAAVVVPLTTGLVSFSRLMLAAFPCLVTAAALLERPWARRAWFAVSAILLALLTARFATWRWVA